MASLSIHASSPESTPSSGANDTPAFAVLNTIQLREKLGQDPVQIIDCRPIDAYNGWKLAGEPCGGHLPGARSLPFKWLDYIDWIEIVRGKGLVESQPVIVYGYDSDETEKVAGNFVRLGFKDVSVYHAFVTEWSGDANHPLQHLKRYRHLVPASWLQTLITTGNAPEYNNNRFVICHSHYQNPSDYKQGHIPGAIALDTNWLESQETWNRRAPVELHERFERLGITHDTTVVLYGRFSHPKNEDPFPGSSAGHLGAMRCAFIMLYAGIKDVRVLNGGLQSWRDAGYEITGQETTPEPVYDFGAPIPGCPEYAVDMPEAKQILADADKNLVSVRSWAEFIGEVSGYNYIEKKGRIPGAVFGNCGSDAYHMENYRNLDHTCREYHEIAGELAAAGITRDHHNAFYCGTGWRGSEAFFNAWLMGWPRVSVFDGGWFEWSSDPSNPIATGTPDASENV